MLVPKTSPGLTTEGDTIRAPVLVCDMGVALCT